MGPGLPSSATILFNCPIRRIMPIISRPPVGVNNDEEHYEVLEIMFLVPQDLPVAVQHEDGGLWTHGTAE